MTHKSNKAAWFCITAGLLAYLFLPWYAIQDTSWYQSMLQTWQQGDAANGLLQAVQMGRPWLLLGLAGLALCVVGALQRPGRAQGLWWLLGGAAGGFGPGYHWFHDWCAGLEPRGPERCVW